MSTCEWGMRWNVARRDGAQGHRLVQEGALPRPRSRPGPSPCTPSGTPIVDARVAGAELAAVDLPARGPHHDRHGGAEVADVGGEQPPAALQDGLLRGHLRPRRDRLLEDEHVVLAPGGLGHDAEARRGVPEPRGGARSGP